GGDSLKAIKVQNISKAANASEILMYRTPASISEHSSRPKTEILFSEEEGCPLSESQLNVFLDMETGSGREYVIPFEFCIPPGVSETDAEKALEKAIEAYPALRGRVSEKDGEPWMYFDSVPQIGKGAPSLPDIRRCLSSFSIGGNRVRGLVSHLGFDGYSFGILCKALEKAVSGEEIGRDPGMLISSSYDRSAPGTARYAASLAHFRSLFEDADTDSGIVPEPDGKQGFCEKKLGIKPAELYSFASGHNSTSGAVAAAAFAYMLSRFTGKQDPVFCITDNGRELPGLDGSIGMFVKTIPLRIICSEDSTDGFISRASKQIYESISASEVPFRKLSGEFGIKSDVIFQYIPGSHPDNLFGNSFSDSGLTAGVIDSGDDLKLILSHGCEISETTAGKMVQAYEMILSGLMKCGNLSEIDYTGNDVPIIKGQRRSLKYAHILDALRDHISDRKLVLCDGRALSYKESDIISDSIAARLEEAGILPGDRVTVMTDRDKWFVLCLLGAL
ncbi:MAG: hypothetical protein J5494_04090, partial [Candidatus Methanomethylophilaceae archaeon]|nr:hypothetical protein [Candidatus Methanomethylophilaceae archaeon]